MNSAERMSATEIINYSFLENRGRLLEIAAFLDRVERAPDAFGAAGDFRLTALRNALAVMLDQQGHKCAAVLRAFSDMSEEPAVSAKGLSTTGAWRGAGG